MNLTPSVAKKKKEERKKPISHGPVSWSRKRGPREWEQQLTASQLLLDEFVLLEGLEADGVHAVATADVTGVEPVDFQRGGSRVQPAEEIVVRVSKGIRPQGVFDTYKRQ